MAKAGSGYNVHVGDGQLVRHGEYRVQHVLDMQRKLYRWSAADPEKKFADLFNIVCDSGTLTFTLGNGWPVTGAAIHRARIA